MYSIKSVKDKDSRRFNLSSCSFEELTTMLVTLYRNKNAAVDPVFIVTYKDDENEIITISSDMELKEAFDVTKASNLMALKLFIQEVSDSTQKEVKNAALSPSPPLSAISSAEVKAPSAPLVPTTLIPSSPATTQIVTSKPPPNKAFQCTAACCVPATLATPATPAISATSVAVTQPIHVVCQGPCCASRPAHVCSGPWCCKPVSPITTASTPTTTTSPTAITAAATATTTTTAITTATATATAASVATTAPKVSLADDSNLTGSSPTLSNSTSPPTSAPEPSPAAKAATAPPLPFATAQDSLASMGFKNRELNEYLLEHHKGHVGEVVNWLLQHGS